jgi:hypothetical protein
MGYICEPCHGAHLRDYLKKLKLMTSVGKVKKEKKLDITYLMNVML